MNLLPRENARRSRPKSPPGPPHRTGFLAGVLLLAGTALLAFWEDRSLGRRILAAQEEGDRLTQQIAEHEGAGDRLAAARELLSDLQASERRLARWDEERFLFPELLRGLAVGVSEEVVLEELRREGSRIWITARTGSADSVAEAARALTRLDRLHALELLWVERVEDSPAAGGQRFALGGELQFHSREPGPFAVVIPVEGERGGGS